MNRNEAESPGRTGVGGNLLERSRLMILYLSNTRNAPNVNNRLSSLVDVTQDAVDDARAAGMHSVADELDCIRARVATIALRLWRGDGGAL